MSKKRPGRSTEHRRLIFPAGCDSPDDFAVFVHDPGFVTDWKSLKLGDDDLRLLEVVLMAAPRRHPVIAGTGGLRKMRFSAEHWDTGKSGGARVLYAHFEPFAVIYLVMAYPKSQRATITAAEKAAIRSLLQSIETRLDRGRYG